MNRLFLQYQLSNLKYQHVTAEQKAHFNENKSQRTVLLLLIPNTRYVGHLIQESMDKRYLKESFKLKLKEGKI